MGARDPLITAAGGGNSWAGIVRRIKDPSFTQPATMVFAQWQVPYVPPIHPAGGQDTVAFWVGLDGYAPDSPIGLLQAGVAAKVIDSPWWYGPFGGTRVEYWAWTEWYSHLHKGEPENDPHKVETVPVAPGDTIFVVVCAPEPDFGFISMLNISRGIGSSVGVNALPGVTWEGGSAEWIVEVPDTSPHMPIFSPVTFTNCTAGSQHEIFDLSHGLPVEISLPGAPTGPFLTQSTIASPTVGLVEQLKTDWF
jgi:hypothetical protein